MIVIVVVVAVGLVVWVSADPVHSDHRDHLLAYGPLVRP